MGKQPRDACPYPRPFPKAFADCSAFEPVDFNAAPSTDVPAQMLRSCANLGIGTFWDGGTHHYGRCRLGDSAARFEFVKHQIVQTQSYIDMQVAPETRKED